jgi:hypothetical protein
VTNAACAIPVPGGCCQPCDYFENFDTLADFTDTSLILGEGLVTAQGSYVWSQGCFAGNARVSSINPLSLTQNLRLGYDAALPHDTDGLVNGGCIVAARIPANAIAEGNTTPFTPSTTECDIAISDPFNTGFTLQPQSRDEPGLFSARIIFGYYGALYVLDDTGAGVGGFFMPGTWDITGGYKHASIVIDPCHNTITYDYDSGTTVYVDIDGVNMIQHVNQFLVYHDNVPTTTTYDVDNVHMTHDPLPCPAVCGDGIITTPEQCDVGDAGATPPIPPSDANCPGRCLADCSCTILCGGPVQPGDPCTACPIVNDVPYTEIATGGWFTWTASAPAYAFETCGINIPAGGAYDSALEVWTGPDCTSLVLVEDNDDCDDNTYGYGLNADPLASCYALGGIPSPYQSCLCVETTVGTQYWISDPRADNSVGRRIHLLASKRAACDAIWGDRGACCDTNSQVSGPAGCRDDVAAADCTAADQHFTKNKSCGSAEVGPCDCVPDCTAFECGSNGCGGSCGTCNDGVDCTIDTCDPLKQCLYTPNDGRCDDGLFCTGTETCTLSGCLPGTNPCLSGQLCDDAADVCRNSACCVFSDTSKTGKTCFIVSLSADCALAGGTLHLGQTCEEANCQNAIPTVSEWGLAITALLLLVGLKVYFGRREALA